MKQPRQYQSGVLLVAAVLGGSEDGDGVLGLGTRQGVSRAWEQLPASCPSVLITVTPDFCRVSASLSD